jgi:hypothetical protein
VHLINLACCVQTPYPNDGDKQFGLQWWILMFEVCAATAALLNSHTLFTALSAIAAVHAPVARSKQQQRAAANHCTVAVCPCPTCLHRLDAFGASYH